MPYPTRTLRFNLNVIPSHQPRGRDTLQTSSHRKCGPWAGSIRRNAGIPDPLNQSLLRNKAQGASTLWKLRNANLWHNWPVLFKRTKTDGIMLQIRWDKRDPPTKCNTWSQFGTWTGCEGDSYKGQFWDSSQILMINCVLNNSIASVIHFLGFMTVSWRCGVLVVLVFRKYVTYLRVKENDLVNSKWFWEKLCVYRSIDSSVGGWIDG